MESISVQTTQNVRIEYPIASAGDRIGAYLIDFIILILLIISVYGLNLYFGLKGSWTWNFLIGFIYFFYKFLFEVFMNGQTPGKRVLNLQVIRIDGTPSTIGNYVIRWIFGIFEYNIFAGAIALIFVVAGGKGQRLGDIVAGTSVIKLTQPEEVKSREVFVQVDTDYIPIFYQVTQLSQHDIELIQRALSTNVEDGNPLPMIAIVEKVKSTLGVKTDLPPIKFLYTIVKDYQHLSSRSL